ncbi:mucin-5AC [Lingula anatina]|uniref:Mucin-5AC n=1 Tax=Lingula anatina TaxID=7574 RepID=A0A1S3HEU3_LINAN|nr:mucin-5AC [Lingula anatina]|eukprot:XP_013384545.1 mucin-5AC [Lingula anatina]
MNPESGIPPAVELVCSYTVDPGETMQVVYFYKDGMTDSSQIVGIVISDGSYQLQNAFASRTDVTVTVSDPSFTLTIGTVTLADEGSYHCKVSTFFNNPMSISLAQNLKLVYRPYPPQITRGPQVATDTYRVTCSSDGGRPAPEIKWFKIQTSDQMEVAVNETSRNEQSQQDTFLVESAVEVMATQADPVELICQLLHDSLISQIMTKITVPESDALLTTITKKPTTSNIPSTTTTESPSNTTGLEVTMVVLPSNGLVMNPASSIPPAVDLVCSYTVDPRETMQVVYFYKDGTTNSSQIVGIVISDVSYQLQNSFSNRTDVTVTFSDPSFTVTIGTVTLADEGSYYCKVSTFVNYPMSMSLAQNLNLVYRPYPPQIRRGPQVATDTYRVTCASDGGRPAPEIKWFKMQSSDQVEVVLNETSRNEQSQGDTFLVESAVEVMATQADPVKLICQLLHVSLISQITSKITVPESAAPSTTTTENPTNSTELKVTLVDLPSNGLVMNPESGIPPTVDLVCSYTVDSGETMQVMYFYKDGTTDSNQIVGIVISDGSYQLQNSFSTRTDVTVTVSDPSFTVIMRAVTVADEGSYYCKVSTFFNNPMSISLAQKLKLVYRPYPPQIRRGPQVATDTYRVTCASDGGRPAPEIKWFKIQTSDQIEVAVNETSRNERSQGDTFLVESAVEVMGTQADPVELTCQLLHDSLISQIMTKITVPESAAPLTTTKKKPTTSNTSTSTNSTLAPNTTTGYISSCEIVRPSIIIVALAASSLMKILL